MNAPVQKQCKKCGTSDRNPSGNCRACAKASQIVWAKKNKEKVRLYGKQWSAKNPEKIRAKNAKAYAANAVKNRAYSAEYKANNLERVTKYLAEYRESHRDIARNTSTVWRKANPLKLKAYHQNRRAMKRNSGGRLTQNVVDRLLKLQRGKCACCNKSLGGIFHLDHIMPLALGGSNEDANMQLLSPRCNLQKHKKHPIDFMQSRGFLL